MDRADQKVALVWIYTGQKPSERLETIGSIDGQHLELIAVGNAEILRAAELFSFSRPDISLQTLDSVSMQAIWQAIPPETKAVVFWIDDEKLVSAGFPLEMAAPILESDPARERHLHYWDGNALAISRSIAEAMTLEDMNLRDDGLLSMMSDIVEHNREEAAFGSCSRLWRSLWLRQWNRWAWRRRRAPSDSRFFFTAKAQSSSFLPTDIFEFWRVESVQRTLYVFFIYSIRL